MTRLSVIYFRDNLPEHIYDCAWQRRDTQEVLKLFSWIKKENSEKPFWLYSFICWLLLVAVDVIGTMIVFWILSLFTIAIDFEHPERMRVMQKCQDYVDVMWSHWMWWSQRKGTSGQSKWILICKIQDFKKEVDKRKCHPRVVIMKRKKD